MKNLADAIYCEAFYQKCDRRWCGRKISRKNFTMFCTNGLRLEDDAAIERKLEEWALFLWANS